MKFLNAILIVVCAIVISCNAMIDKETAELMARQILSACKAQEGGSDADVEAMMSLNYPSTREGNCMMACAHEKMGFFDNGSFLRENFMAAAKMVTEGEPTFMKMAEEISDTCGKTTGERCEQALAFNQCMDAEAKARNIHKLDLL